MGILKYVFKFICKYRGHTITILEVHQFNDVLRCSRCDAIRGLKNV